MQTFAPRRSGTQEARLARIEQHLISLGNLPKNLAQLLQTRLGGATGGGQRAVAEGIVGGGGGGGDPTLAGDVTGLTSATLITALPEAKVAFDPAAGHAHDGAGSHTVAMAGAVTGTNTATVVTGLPESHVTFDPTAGHAHDGTGSHKVAITGDVTGDNTAAVVAKLQGVALSAAVATAGQEYLYDGSNLVPVRKALFDHYADVGNGVGETDLFSDTLAAGQLGVNGQKVLAVYGGSFTGAASSTQQLRAYFGGTLIFDTGALAIGAVTDSWEVRVTVIRESSSVVRCSVSLGSNATVLAAASAYTRVTGLTLANTQILKITGTAAGVGAAANQVVASLASVQWLNAA